MQDQPANHQDADGAQAPCAVTIVAHDIGHVGGMERQIVQLIGGLRRLGHPVSVIARTCELPAGVEVDFHRVRGPGRPFLLAYPWFLIAGSLAVRRHRRGVLQGTGAIVLNQLDTIAVHYCHQVGVTTASQTGALAGFYIRLVGAVSRIFERLCFNLNRRALFLCVSDGVAEELREHYPRAADRVLTIHNGVDIELFNPGARSPEAAELRHSLGIAPDRLTAVFVGSEWERKGLGQVIRALSHAPGWDLLVAGAGDRESYSALAESLGVARAIHWLGVSRDVPLVYELGDALVFPSSYEAFPLVILEAAAAGMAILTTPVNGARELLVDGDSALMITRDPALIGRRLSELEEEQLRRRIAMRARAAVLPYTWERMVLAHHELFQRIARARAGG